MNYLPPHDNMMYEKVKQYDDKKFWMQCELQKINLDDIDFKPQHKDEIYKMIVEKGTCYPVYLTFDLNSKKYKITNQFDGHSTCYGAKSFGYTHIAAMVYVEIKSPPCSLLEMEKWRMYNLVYENMNGILKIVNIKEIDGSNAQVTVSDSWDNHFITNVSKNLDGTLIYKINNLIFTILYEILEYVENYYQKF